MFIPLKMNCLLILKRSSCFLATFLLLFISGLFKKDFVNGPRGNRFGAYC